MDCCPGDQFAEKVCQEQLSDSKDYIDELVCKICFNVVGCNPKLAKCSHLFCGDCLEQWFAAQPSNQTWAQRAKTAGAIPCPTCKTPLHKQEDVYPVMKDGKGISGLLWRMLSAQSVQCCKAHDGGFCSWRGAYSKYSEHMHSGTCGQELGKETEECSGSDSASTTCKSTCEYGTDTTPGMESASHSDTESHSEFLVERGSGKDETTSDNGNSKLPPLQMPAKAESGVPSTPSTRSDSHKDNMGDEEQEEPLVCSEQQPDLMESQDLQSLLKTWVELKVEEGESDPSKVIAGTEAAIASPTTSSTQPNKAGDNQIPKPSAATAPTKSAKKTKNASKMKQNPPAGSAAAKAEAQAHAYRAQLAQWHAAHAQAAQMVQWNAACTQAAMAHQYQRQVAAQMQMAAAVRAGYMNGLSGSR